MSKTRSFKVDITLTATAVMTEKEVKEAIESFNRQSARIRDGASRGDDALIKACKALDKIVPNGLTEENFDEVFPRLIRSAIRKEFRESREVDLSGSGWRSAQAEVKITAKGGAHE